MEYYHLMLELKNGKILTVLNQKHLESVERNYLIPHFKGENYFIDGKECSKAIVSKIIVTESKDTSLECVNIFRKDGVLAENDEIECIFNNRHFAKNITQKVYNKINNNIQKDNDWLIKQLIKFKGILDFRVKIYLNGLKFLLLGVLIGYVWLIVLVFEKYNDNFKSLISLLIPLSLPLLSLCFMILTGRKFIAVNEWKKLKDKLQLKVYEKHGFDQIKFDKFKSRAKD